MEALTKDESHQTAPLGPIALALSGGGYRAAAFHLGTLRTLHETGLLKSVDILSTVSGGTIVGTSYALSQVQHKSFERFYDDFLSRLRTQRPVHRATQLLTRQHKSLPRRTLITAQAQALDEQFYGGETFGKFFNSPIHIGEIIFNATDFRCGLPFRFQKSRNPRAKIGNGKHWMPVDVAREMRLADLVAASSCFPGGFEPIGFPHDFVWQDRDAILNQLATDPDETTFVDPLPLMDGGVADNQGLGSLRIAFDRREKEDLPPIGLMLISDADSPNNRPLIEHSRQPKANWFSVNNAILCGRVLLVMAIIAVVSLGWRLAKMITTRSFPSWWEFVESTFAFVVLGIAAAGLFAGLRWLDRALFQKLPARTGFDVVGTIGTLNPSWIGDLLWMRIESLFAMSNNVFMKSVRDLRYREMYENEKLCGRVVANLIYELPKHLDGQHEADVTLQPSKALIEITAYAAAMPTTLWFDHSRQLDAVVLSGRATACYNLVQHIEKQLASTDVGGVEAVKLRDLHSRLLTIWRDIENEVEAFPLATLESY